MSDPSRLLRDPPVDRVVDRVARTPLPMFPVHLAGPDRGGAFYYFSEKLIYDDEVRAWALPILRALHRRRPQLLLVQNGGDLFHDGHRARTAKLIEELGSAAESATVLLVCDPPELELLHRLVAGTVDAGRLTGRFFHANRLADPDLFATGAAATWPWVHVARLVRVKRHELLLDALDLLGPTATERLHHLPEGPP